MKLSGRWRSGKVERLVRWRGRGDGRPSEGNVVSLAAKEDFFFRWQSDIGFWMVAGFLN